jgi:threonine/homoserine/homoserine lactone efflux protein
MWRDARAPIAPTRPAMAGRAYRQGIAINVLNPNSVLFAAAVLVVILPRDLGRGGPLFVAANHFVLDMFFYTGLTALLSRPAAIDRYMAAKPHLDRPAACLLGPLGLRLLTDRTG